MADEERPTNGGGFDDWLEEEPGPDTDPYAALAAADDDAEAEISEWMAFTEGADAPNTAPEQADPPTSGAADRHADDDGSVPEPEPVDVPVEADAGTDADGIDGLPEDVREVPSEDLGADVPERGPDEPAEEPTEEPTEEPAEEPTEEPTEEPAEEPTEEPTEELVIAAPSDEIDSGVAPATSVDVAEFDGGGRPDTEEIPIITGSPEIAASERSGDVPGLADAEVLDMGDEDDTGEMPVLGGVPVDADHEDTGELHPVPVPDDGDSGVFDLDAADSGPDETDQPFDVSQDDYLATATREHAGLAAAIAEAETSETEQVALAAPIPGLETTVVGFEDVVEAEGHTKARARASGDLLARVVTGVILIAAVGVSLVYRPALVALATVVFIIGAGEFYTALRRSGRQPISLFGFLGILGASVGAFVWGAIAIPTSFLLVAALLLLFYAVVPGKPEPMANLALTVTVMLWAGLGTYAMMIIASDDFRPLVIGVVLTVALMDIAQYFIGRGLGRHQLSPWVSPKKTVEGLVGGVIVALALGALLHFIPPFELTSGLAVGAAVAVLSPLGDLAMSAAKRALGIKDMGSILPGHGGFLDRIDGLLFVIPAVWAIFLWAGLI